MKSTIGIGSKPLEGSIVREPVEDRRVPKG